MIFWDFPMFYQIFFSPQVERCVIITYKHGIYELPNDSRIKKWGNIYPMSYCSLPEHITGSNAHETQPRKIEKGGGQAPQGATPGAPGTPHQPWTSPQYPRNTPRRQIDTAIPVGRAQARPPQYDFDMQRKKRVVKLNTCM